MSVCVCVCVKFLGHTHLIKTVPILRAISQQQNTYDHGRHKQSGEWSSQFTSNLDEFTMIVN